MKPSELRDRVAGRDGRISPELDFQYANLFHVLSVTIRPLSRVQWVSGATPASTPVRQACHIIRSCDAYASQTPEDRFGVPVHLLDGDIAIESLPSVRQAIAYVDDVRGRVHDWLGEMSNEDLLGPAPNPGWSQRGWTMLGHVVYVLRHGTLHLGHLRAELRRRGIRTGVFK